MSQPRRGRCELIVTDAAVAINNSGLFRVDLRRAFEKYERRKWGKPGLEKGCHSPILARRTTPIKTIFATLLRQEPRIRPDHRAFAAECSCGCSFTDLLPCRESND